METRSLTTNKPLNLRSLLLLEVELMETLKLPIGFEPIYTHVASIIRSGINGNYLNSLIIQ